MRTPVGGDAGNKEGKGRKRPGARAAGKAITLEDQLPKGKREGPDDAPPRSRGPTGQSPLSSSPMHRFCVSQQVSAKGMPLPDDAWMSRREALHDRYLRRRPRRRRVASRLSARPDLGVDAKRRSRRSGRARVSAAPAGEREPLNCVYIHVPFCKSICSFCNYDRLQPSSPDLLKNVAAARPAFDRDDRAEAATADLPRPLHRRRNPLGPAGARCCTSCSRRSTR